MTNIFNIQFIKAWLFIAASFIVINAPAIANEFEPYSTSSINSSSLDSTQLSCLLEPSSRVEISSQVPGVVKKVSIERGALVKKGQEVMVLHNGVEKTALESALAKAEFAKRKYERNSELLRKGLLSDYERDELLTEQKLGDLAVREARERLKQRTIYSPITGLVVKRHISVGEFVGEEPVMELVALDPLNVEVILRAENHINIKKGAPVSIEIAGAEKAQYKGTVTIVDQVIDAASGTFGVRVKLPNPGNKLRAGLKCHAVFE